MTSPYIQDITSRSFSRFVKVAHAATDTRTNRIFPQSYEILLDPYHGVQRLNLFQFDGSPMNPMYLEYSPTPQMLPTATLNPTASSTGGGQASSTGSSKRKRSEPGSFDIPSNTKVLLDKRSGLLNPDRWWWFGVGATALGGFAYFAF